MKKVRYVIGVFGVAPTLGFMMPSANAMSAVTHATGKASKTVSLKTVSLEHSTRSLEHSTRNSPVCGNSATKTATLGHFSGKAFYAGECIQLTRGRLNFDQNGLSMRTRLYSINGTRTFQNFVHGTQPFFGSSTVFFSNTSRGAEKDCQALVLSHSRAVVKYGPVCETI